MRNLKINYSRGIIQESKNDIVEDVLTDSEEDLNLAWEENEDPKFRSARWTASNIYKNRISVSAALLWIGLVAWIFGSAIDILYLIGEPLIEA